jgi:hypothetical protein
MVRLKPDGSLDLDWRDPPPVKTTEQMFEELISELMRDDPQLTREEAEKHLDGFF